MNSENNVNPQSESGQHLEQAYSYKDRNQFKDVLREADAAIKIDPSVAEAHNLRGIALEELGRESEAIEAYRQALSLNPNFKEARDNLSDLEASLYLEQGFKHKEVNKYEDVLTEADAAIKIDPSVAEAHNLRGIALEELGRESEAIEAYRQALSLNPNFKEAKDNLSDLETRFHLEQAYSYKEANKLEDVLREADAAIKIDPSVAEAHNLRGIALEELGRETEAIKAYQQAIDQDSKFREAKSNLSDLKAKLKAKQQAGIIATSANPQEANTIKSTKSRKKILTILVSFVIVAAVIASIVAPLSTSHRLSTYDEALEYTQYWSEAYSNGNYSMALYYANKSLELNDDSAYLYYLYDIRGNSYLGMGEISLAIADFNKSISLNPNDAPTYGWRGEAYFYMGEVELALADLNQSIQLNPDYAFSYWWRGLVYYNLSEMEMALADFNQSVSIDPYNAYAYEGRGAVYYALRELEMALADYNKTILLDSTHARTYVSRGRVYCDLIKMDQAMADFNQSIQLDPYNAYAYYYRGVVYYNLSEMEMALADFNQSIRLNSDDAFSYGWRGRIYYDLDDMEQAIVNFNQSLKLDPDYARGYYWRGMAYKSIGNKHQAIADLQTCLTLNPDQDTQQKAQTALHQLGVK
jgi:tetratricopeptide (TPR) repeat protein